MNNQQLKDRLFDLHEEWADKCEVIGSLKRLIEREERAIRLIKEEMNEIQAMLDAPFV